MGAGILAAFVVALLAAPDVQAGATKEVKPDAVTDAQPGAAPESSAPVPAALSRLAALVDTMNCIEPVRAAGSTLSPGFDQIGRGQWLATEAWALGPCLSGFAFRDTAGRAEPSILLTPAESADGVVRANIFLSWGTRWAGVAFRYRGPDDYLAAIVSTRDRSVRLVEVTGGKTRRLANWKGPIDPGSAHDLTVDFRGHDVEIWLDSTRVIRSRYGGYCGAGRVGLTARTAPDGIPRFGWLQIGR